VAILIDDSSGSASEVFTGVLQENGRAIVVGHTSYGGMLNSTTRWVTTLVRNIIRKDVVDEALAVVLLVCTSLMTRALLGLLMTEPGFRPENVITMRVSLPRARYSNPDSLRQFYTSILDGVRQIPGVQQAGAGSSTGLARTTSPSG
jgi:hypothetical protein